VIVVGLASLAGWLLLVMIDPPARTGQAGTPMDIEGTISGEPGSVTQQKSYVQGGNK